MADKDKMAALGFKVQLNPLIFPDQAPPVGFIMPDMACQACWYFYLMAENGRRAFAGGIENQIIEVEEGKQTPLWMDKLYNSQAKSVAFLYGLESPDSWLPFWPNVKMEARRLGLNPPLDEYMILSGRDRIT